MNDETQNRNDVAPRTDDTRRIQPLAGADRSGLGEKGWAEVPEDLIGGHPELEAVPKSGPDGDLNGPQPETDPATSAPVGKTEKL
jgi:hypothetical protein